MSSRAAAISNRGEAQRGFVLAATLWVLAIVTIGAAFFAERVSSSLALARQKQQTAEALVAFSNTRAEMLFRLGTTRMTRAGLGANPIVVDDRPYRGAADDVVRLQDNRGLINVNFVDTVLMQRFLGLMGVPREQRDAMIDALLDYTDEDDLRRLNGAERAEYEAAGLPKPPNDWLASPHQLKSIIGWRDQHDLWDKKDLMRFVTTSRAPAGFNPNSAPPEVLASIPGMTPESAARLVKRRQTALLYNELQLAEYGAASTDPEAYLFFPGYSIRITQQSPKVPWAVQFNVTLTPHSEESPWRIDYYTRTVVSYAVENEAEIPKLPALGPGSSDGSALQALTIGDPAS